MTLPGVYCPRCGIQNADDSKTCISCGNDLRTWGSTGDEQQPAAQKPPYPQQPQAPQPYPGQPYGPPQQIPNYLPQAIILTVVGVCCWILPTAAGIPAIVFAAQVNTKLAAGDVPGALHSSRLARIWCWVSFGLVVTIGLLQVSLFALPFTA